MSPAKLAKTIFPLLPPWVLKLFSTTDPTGKAKDNHPAEIEAAAKAHGIQYIYQPVVGTAISDEDAEEFGNNIANNDGPIFAHCRTGTRCTILWMLSQAKNQSADDLLATAAKAGYSLEKVRGRLEGLGNQTV